MNAQMRYAVHLRSAIDSEGIRGGLSDTLVKDPTVVPLRVLPNAAVGIVTEAQN